MAFLHQRLPGVASSSSRCTPSQSILPSSSCSAGATPRRIPGPSSSFRTSTFPSRQQQQQQQQQTRVSRLVARANPLGALVFKDGYTDVEEVQGMRLHMEGDTPKTEYLVKWKDAADSTWEPAINLSEDLIREYEDKWWQAARKADLEAMAKMLGGGKETLSIVVDDNGRSALHFAAGLGNLDCVKLLVEAQADVNLQDREGYTPLHMAAGYMHTSAMTLLLEAGADPTLKDNQGRDVVQLVDNLRGQMPLSPVTITRRIALEQVAGVLMERVYEEVQPAQILNVRRLEEDGPREFLVQFADGRDDEWVNERDMAPDVVEDYDAGLEYATAQRVVDVVQVGTERRFKVEWSDGYPTSWEPEESLPTDLIKLFQQENPQLFDERVAAAEKGEVAPGAWPQSAELEWAGATGETDGYATQYQPVQVTVAAAQLDAGVRQAVGV